MQDGDTNQQVIAAEDPMNSPRDTERRVAEIEAELSGLEARRTQLLEELRNLRQPIPTSTILNQLTFSLSGPSVTNQSPQEEKSNCFAPSSVGAKMFFPGGLKAPKPGKQDTSRSAATSGLPEFARNQRYPAQNAVPENSSPSVMKSSAII
jgi:hypothetical protein